MISPWIQYLKSKYRYSWFMFWVLLGSKIDWMYSVFIVVEYIIYGTYRDPGVASNIRFVNLTNPFSAISYVEPWTLFELFTASILMLLKVMVI